MRGEYWFDSSNVTVYNTISSRYWFNPSILHQSQIHMVRHCITEWVTQGFLIRMVLYDSLLMVASYVCNHSCRHSLIGRTPIRAVQVRLLLVAACKIHLLCIGRHT